MYTPTKITLYDIETSLEILNGRIESRKDHLIECYGLAVLYAETLGCSDDDDLTIAEELELYRVMLRDLADENDCVTLPWYLAELLLSTPEPNELVEELKRYFSTLD